jgi:hypothetical protein
MNSHWAIHKGYWKVAGIWPNKIDTFWTQNLTLAGCDEHLGNEAVNQ